jgi:hypothetical protein
MIKPADVAEAMELVGCTSKQIAAALRALVKPTSGAARQARYRKRKRDASDVTVRNAGGDGEELAGPRESDESDVTLRCVTSQEKEKGAQKEKERTSPSLRSGDYATRVSARGERLPEGWAPSSETVAFAGNLGFAGRSLDEAVAEFGDYWRAVPGQRALKLDWEATFRNRLRETAGRKRGTAHGNGKGSLVEASDELVRRLDKQFAYLDGGVRPEDRGQDGPSTVRFLSGQRG